MAGLIDVQMLFLIYSFGWNSFQIGLIMTVHGLCNIVFQGLLSRYLLPRLGERKTILLATVINMVRRPRYLYSRLDDADADAATATATDVVVATETALGLPCAVLMVADVFSFLHSCSSQQPHTDWPPKDG